MPPDGSGLCLGHDCDKACTPFSPCLRWELCWAELGAVSSVDTIALEKRLVADQVAASIEQVPVDADRIRHRVETEKRLARPFLSANDRSRWLTIRALVEQGTFTIDGLVTEPGWDTIDAVVHPDSSGKLRLYSSKPPLLSVLLAGFYWLLHAVSGWTLGDHPFEMGRLLMVLYGLVPLGITIHFTCRLIDAIGTSDWGRIWAAALICCGTMLTTFAVVLTNHIPAAACTAASAWLLYRIRCDGVRSWWYFATAGLCLGLAAALDLPAIAWMLAAFVVLARCDWRRTACAALPAALLVGCVFFGTNWLAHGTFAPPYAHRKPAASGQPNCCELPSRASLSLSGAATGALSKAAPIAGIQITGTTIPSCFPMGKLSSAIGAPRGVSTAASPLLGPTPGTHS